MIHDALIFLMLCSSIVDLLNLFATHLILKRLFSQTSCVDHHYLNILEHFKIISPEKLTCCLEV